MCILRVKTTMSERSGSQSAQRRVFLFILEVRTKTRFRVNTPEISHVAKCYTACHRTEKKEKFIRNRPPSSPVGTPTVHKNHHGWHTARCKHDEEKRGYGFVADKRTGVYFSF